MQSINWTLRCQGLELSVSLIGRIEWIWWQARPRQERNMQVIGIATSHTDRGSQRCARACRTHDIAHWLYPCKSIIIILLRRTYAVREVLTIFFCMAIGYISNMYMYILYRAASLLTRTPLNAHLLSAPANPLSRLSNQRNWGLITPSAAWRHNERNLQSVSYFERKVHNNLPNELNKYS